MNPIEQFEVEKKQRINSYGDDEKILDTGRAWLEESMRKNYAYNFTWLGRPIIQQPQDIVAMQEIIWQLKPDLIVETGVAHGGSLILYSSILELIGDGIVVGVDIDIRAHNRAEIENHPMAKRIKLIQGSSTEPKTVEQVEKYCQGKRRVLVCLDSYHTQEHVLKELEIYSKFVSVGSYIIVFDSFVQDMPENFYPDRPWTVGDNPKTAVWNFVKENKNFVIDKSIHNKLIVTCCPDGFLKRVE